MAAAAVAFGLDLCLVIFLGLLATLAWGLWMHLDRRLDTAVAEFFGTGTGRMD